MRVLRAYPPRWDTVPGGTPSQCTCIPNVHIKALMRNEGGSCKYSQYLAHIDGGTSEYSQSRFEQL
jgi:hypothetical protein